MTDPHVPRFTEVRWFCVLASLFTVLCASGFAQTMTLPEIQAALCAQPPATGDPAEREAAIDNLDLYLSNGTARYNADVIAFYEGMMGGLASDIDMPTTTGARVWSTYCSGNVVKTPSATIGFDLIDGCSGWSYSIPDSVLQRIQVLFITHCRHSEHWDSSVVNAIKGFGGIVVTPSEDLLAYGGDVGLAAGQSTLIGNLHVKAYAASHGVPTRIFQVTTQEGLTFLYAGAFDRSTDLPDGVNVDVLFVSGYVNEGGSTNYTVGMRNSINRVKPTVLIPGHLQDVSVSTTWRLAYSWAQAVDDVPVSGLVSVQTWGERFDVELPPPPAGVGNWFLYR